MKQSMGFTQVWPTLGMLVFMVGSFGLLALGAAYTIWTGIGAVGAIVTGLAVLGEAASPLRLLAAVLMVCGLVLMKPTSEH